MAAAPEEERVERVSTLELFFDLVFVFTITQLTAFLSHEPSWHGLLQVVLMLGVIWWMYGGYAWLTNAVTLDGAARQALLLCGMAAYLVLALAIPQSFDDDGLAFGLAYLAIVTVHAALFTRASGRGAKGILRIAPFNFLSAGLVLVGGAIGGHAQEALWAAAVLLEWCTPFFVPPHAFFEIRSEHFVERHGLVVLIAIGESVVAIGIGAAGLDLDAALAAVAILGLTLSACLWWAYFGGDDERALQALIASGEARPLLGLRAFGIWHLPLLLGIVAIAFGLEHALAHPFDAATRSAATGLALGSAAFLAGDIGFRMTLGIGHAVLRSLAALLAIATLPLGTAVAATAQIGALVAIIGGALMLERVAERQPTASRQNAQPG